MDINKFDVVKNADKGFKLYFKNPYDMKEELPWFMVVRGADSKVYKNALREKKLTRLNKKASENKESTDATAEDLEQIEADNMEILCRLVISVGETEEKQELDYILDGERQCKATKKDLKHLFTKFPWMLDQVTVCVANRANFLG